MAERARKSTAYADGTRIPGERTHRRTLSQCQGILRDQRTCREPMGKHTGFRIVEHIGKNSTEHAKPKGTHAECTGCALGTEEEISVRGNAKDPRTGNIGEGGLVRYNAWRNAKKTLVSAQGMQWENAARRSQRIHGESRRI